MNSGKRYRKYIKSGIYKITCTSNNKIYIGSAVDTTRRKGTHFSRLNKGDHHCTYLQHAYNKYGKESMRWEIIELCEIENLIEREQYYMDLYDSHNPRKGFNVAKIAGSLLGHKFGEGHRSKASKRSKGLLNPTADKAIYHFVHAEFGDEYCTRQDLAIKYGLSSGNANSLGQLIRGYKGRKSVQGWYLNSIKVTDKISKRIKDIDSNQVVADYLKGDSGMTIALRLGISEPTVYEIIKRAGAKVRSWREGQTYKIDLKTDIDKLIKEYLGGKSRLALETKYNICEGTIKRILIDRGIKIRSHEQATLNRICKPYKSRSINMSPCKSVQGVLFSQQLSA